MSLICLSLLELLRLLQPSSCQFVCRSLRQTPQFLLLFKSSVNITASSGNSPSGGPRCQYNYTLMYTLVQHRNVQRHTVNTHTDVPSLSLPLQLELLLQLFLKSALPPSNKNLPPSHSFKLKHKMYR